MGEERKVYKFLRETPKKRDQPEGRGIDDRMDLKSLAGECEVDLIVAG
jgi:hypothetical protein